MGTISRSGISGGGTIQATHITNIIDALDGTSTTTTVVATGSFSGSLVGIATSASYATTASYALNAAAASSFPYTGSAIISGSLKVTGSLNVSGGVTASLLGSASYATTASYALNAGGGVGFPFTGSAQVTGSMGITGSLNVTAGVTASLVGTASYTNTARSVEVVRTTTSALYYPLIVDSANSALTPESVYSTSNISVNPSTGVISSTGGLTVTGSFNVSQSLTVAPGAALYVSSSTVDGSVTGSNNFILNLTDLGKTSGKGTLVLPTYQPTYPVRGSVYVDFDGAKLYLYDGSGWVSIGIV